MLCKSALTKMDQVWTLPRHRLEWRRQANEVELLRKYPRGDHSVHAVRCTRWGIDFPDYRRNQPGSSRVNTTGRRPLTRMPVVEATIGTVSSGGITQSVPDGKNSIYSHGYRNIFDADFNADVTIHL